MGERRCGERENLNKMGDGGLWRQGEREYMGERGTADDGRKEKNRLM